MKKRVWEIVEASDPDDFFGRGFDAFIITLIVLNVIAVIVGTDPYVRDNYGTYFYGFELVSVIIFSVEYLLRIWACSADPRYKHPVLGRLRFATTPLAAIDLMAVAPFYLVFFGVDLRFLRVFRLMRIFRLAKLGRYLLALTLMSDVVKSKREELTVTTALMLLLLIVASSLMYFVENPVQPDSFPSIASSMWWAIATLTTVGYGDVYPITTSGRLIASLVAVLGIGFFALPIGILGAGFVEEVEKRKRNILHRCPHCGGELEG
jgi:voltage-gated potassium channel